MGAYAEIAKVNAIIEQTRAKSAHIRKPKLDNAVMAELKLREERILRRRAAEDAEVSPDRPPRPLMFNRPVSRDSALTA